jgi:hypothetical protein
MVPSLIINEKKWPRAPKTSSFVKNDREMMDDDYRDDDIDENDLIDNMVLN